MAVQLAVRALLALRRHRADASAKAEAAQQLDEKDSDENTAQADSQPSKPRFAIDGVPLKQATFDPDDPDSASAYPDEEGDDARDRRCTLCLGPRRDQTATECGHVCECAAMLSPDVWQR